MTPLHILCCNFKVHHRVFNVFVQKATQIHARKARGEDVITPLTAKDSTQSTPLNLFLACRGLLNYDDIDGPSLLKLFDHSKLYQGELPMDQWKILRTLGIDKVTCVGMNHLMIAAWRKDYSLQKLFNLLLSAPELALRR